MKLLRIDIFNFRLLKQASINISQSGATTILVGPNNSGKTSVAESLMLFAGDGRKHFSLHDFSVSCFAEIDAAEKLFKAAKDDIEAGKKLPKIWLDLHLEYKDEGPDLAVASDLLMDLDPKSKEVGIRIEFAVSDPIKLGEEFRATKKDKQTLQEFLGKALTDFFTLRYSKINSTGGEAVALEGKSILDRVLKVDFVFAQRHIDDQENNRAMRLSHLLHAHYEKHYKTAEPENHQEIEKTLDGHAKDLGGKYMKAFDGLIKSLKQFGYPQQQAPEMAIRAELNSTTLFKDHTRIFYGVQQEESNAGGGKKEKQLVELPEKYNGLGFKNLIYMILQIQSFRVALDQMTANRPRVHLLFIEEPEAHLHPQMQTVFTKQISGFLGKDGKGDDAQLILTTHSSHIVADCGFAPIRYFRAKGDQSVVKDLSTFEKTVTTEEALRFLSKYLSLTRCDLFFADKAILVEGQVERMLLRQMVGECAKRVKPDFVGEYLSVVEVGGAHAHKFEKLIKFIEIPTLVITDIDSVDTKGKACRVSDELRSSNGTLKEWLPKKLTIGELRKASEASKLDGPTIRVAYQVPEKGSKNCGRSFEEAFVYRNAAYLVASCKKLSATGSKFEKHTVDTLTKEAFELDLPKVEFALDLLVMDGWETPLYIAEGLDWLATVKVVA